LIGSAVLLSAQRRHKRRGWKQILVNQTEVINMLGTILLIVLVLLLIGAFPTWPHSRAWGYGPTGGLGVVLIVVIVLLITGVI
jgi:sterol desaturase/sphingolipid hydroxylase (fatty acid hydroxylase superfamily)